MHIDNSPEAIRRKAAERDAKQQERDNNIQMVMFLIVGMILIALSLLIGFTTGNYWIGIIIAIILIAGMLCMGYFCSFCPCYGTNIRATWTNARVEHHMQEQRI